MYNEVKLVLCMELILRDQWAASAQALGPTPDLNQCLGQGH